MQSGSSIVLALGSVNYLLSSKPFNPRPSYFRLVDKLLCFLIDQNLSFDETILLLKMTRPFRNILTNRRHLYFYAFTIGRKTKNCLEVSIALRDLD